MKVGLSDRRRARHDPAVVWDAWTIAMTLLPPLEVAWVAVAAVYILLQRRSATATIAWILALAFFPIVGIVLYILIGPRRFERRKRRRAIAHEVVDRNTTIDAHAIEVGPRQSHLITMLATAVGRAGRARRADLEVFLDGKSKFDALEKAIREAGRHIHLEYYIWEPDRIGTRLRDLLTERAEQGVEVRVLIDGFGSNKAQERFWRPLCKAGGQVRRFNEVSLMRWRPRMSNFRSHRKIAVIDGTIGFTGGMNVSDVHTSEFSGEEAWRDTHLMLRGSAVKGLQMVFFEDWHYAGGDAPDTDRYLPEVGAVDHGDHLVQVVSSGPDEGLDAIHKLFFVSIASACDRVELTTPYFVPDQSITDALRAAALRGADVRLLVPEGGDQPFVAAAARSYYPELLDAGVRIHEYGEPVLHSKTLVVDDVAMIGTANTDNRSFRLNFEVVVAIHDAAVSDSLSEAFRTDLENAREVTAKDMADESLGRRLMQSIARLFSPIL